jgi:hypothetical protein
VAGGLKEWDRYLLQPHVRETEQKVLECRSVVLLPAFLDLTPDEGRPHDYVLYRHFVWTLDDDVRFDGEMGRLFARLERQIQRLTSDAAEAI